MDLERSQLQHRHPRRRHRGIDCHRLFDRVFSLLVFPQLGATQGEENGARCADENSGNQQRESNRKQGAARVEDEAREGQPGNGEENRRNDERRTRQLESRQFPCQARARRSGVRSASGAASVSASSSRCDAARVMASSTRGSQDITMSTMVMSAKTGSPPVKASAKNVMLDRPGAHEPADTGHQRKGRASVGWCSSKESSSLSAVPRVPASHAGLASARVRLNSALWNRTARSVGVTPGHESSNARAAVFIRTASHGVRTGRANASRNVPSALAARLRGTFANARAAGRCDVVVGAPLAPAQLLAEDAEVIEPIVANHQHSVG